MILTKKQRVEFEKASHPLIKWMNENCHPHVVALIEPERAVLTEGVYSVPITDYIQD